MDWIFILLIILGVMFIIIPIFKGLTSKFTKPKAPAKVIDVKAIEDKQ